MGRHESNHDQSLVVHSSIALLQERFRQLQKVKEMREEKELLRLLSLSNPKKHALFNACVLLDPSVARFLPCHEFTTPTVAKTTTSSTMLTLPQTSLSLWPTTSPNKLGGDMPPLMNLWPVDNTTSCTTNSSSCDSVVSLISKLDDHDRNNHESDSDSDVDTSLHL